MEGPTVIKIVVCGECEHKTNLSSTLIWCDKANQAMSIYKNALYVTPKECPFRENVVV